MPTALILINNQSFWFTRNDHVNWSLSKCSKFRLYALLDGNFFSCRTHFLMAQMIRLPCSWSLPSLPSLWGWPALSSIRHSWASVSTYYCTSLNKLVVPLLTYKSFLGMTGPLLWGAWPWITPSRYSTCCATAVKVDWARSEVALLRGRTVCKHTASKDYVWILGLNPDKMLKIKSTS